ncbi:hypothetical protein H2O64_22610 [Kordia sp. YSTF-M3]|uniref:Uncharacterized protein n=1 Tax=Kordia aestuariivivens TaxID=2759037 RepID=A0ABR7QFZ0_9FLAO|nr:hypothetical protein [Kordia aestuariivivens]MBC8757480.1 hypothetical protein [Kordia aestuariivivens]
MMKKEISINSIEQLHELKFIVKRFKNIELKLPYLNDAQNETWEELVKKEYFSCGCTTGSYFVGIGILCTLVYIVYTLLFELPISIKIILITIVGMAILGKLAGLLFAHFRLLRVIQSLYYLRFNKNYKNT